MQIGTFSSKKNTLLFNFEEPNLRHFYQRIKDYYKIKDWEYIDPLAPAKRVPAGSRRVGPSGQPGQPGQPSQRAEITSSKSRGRTFFLD